MVWRREALKSVLAICLVTLVGCKDPVTWSTASRSPDGKWVAHAQTIEYGGFGTGGVETNVEIELSNGSGSSQRVLSFADGGGSIGLKLRWDSPSHLVATYKAHPDLLYFQVVKTSGLDISVENLSAHPEQEYRPSLHP